jgi:hypothetical protein
MCVVFPAVDKKVKRNSVFLLCSSQDRGCSMVQGRTGSALATYTLAVCLGQLYVIQRFTWI